MTVKVEIWFDPNRAGAEQYGELEYDKEEWENMSEEEKHARVRDDMFEEFGLSWGYEVYDE